MSLAHRRWERERQRVAELGYLTTAQAARLMGVPVHMVKTWASLGLISNYGAGGKGSVALWDEQQLRTAPARRINLRAQGTCTVAGCDEPHRAKGCCARHYKMMRRGSGQEAPSQPPTPSRNAETTLRRGGGVTPPRSLPYRALAKSCPECGDLRTTPDDLIWREAGALPSCRRCRVMRVTRNRNERMERDEQFKKKQQRRTDALRARAQAQTVDLASNAGKQWTGPELEIACREDLSAREVAAMLGRTLYAVKHMRRLVRIDPRKDRLANVPPRKARKVTMPLR